MKKLIAIAFWVGGALLIAAIGATFFIQLKSHSVLQRELADKKAEFNDAQDASRKLENLEKKSAELKQKENALAKRVAAGEKEPFGLLRVITQTATQTGLRNLQFKLKSESALPLVKKPYVLPAAPQPRYFRMTGEGTFPHVVAFLKSLAGLDRIVDVERVEVNRKDKLLPYQEVTIDMATYSFSE